MTGSRTDALLAAAVGERPERPSCDVVCRSCGCWLATVPLGTAWTRSRCSNRRCAEHGKTQTRRFEQERGTLGT